MKKIKEFLLNNKYEIYEDKLNNIIEGNNEFLHILVMKKDEGKYLVRNAIGCYFDRWANSGTEFWVNSEDEVIKYFSEKTKCITDAVGELVYTVIEESEWANSDEKIRKMIDGLYSLIKDE